MAPQAEEERAACHSLVSRAPWDLPLLSSEAVVAKPPLAEGLKLDPCFGKQRRLSLWSPRREWRATNTMTAQGQSEITL